MATYDSGDAFDQSLAKGFVELWGLPSKMAARRDQRRRRTPRPDPPQLTTWTGVASAGVHAC